MQVTAGKAGGKEEMRWRSAQAESGHMFHHLAGKGYCIKNGYTGGGKFHGRNITGSAEEIHLSI